MRRLISAAAALVMAAGPVLGQQNGASFPPPDQLPDHLRLDSIVRLAAIEAVQRDLGVGEDVARKLTLLHNDYQAANKKEYEKAGLIRPVPGPGKFGSTGKQTDEQRQQILEIRGRLNDEFIPKTMELLSADQVKRFYQIQLQGRLRSGPRALLAPPVALKLKLTDRQKESLTAQHTEMREKQFPGGAGVRSSKESQERLRNIEAEYAAKAMEVLTADQKGALNMLMGKEFDVSKLPPN